MAFTFRSWVPKIPIKYKITIKILSKKIKKVKISKAKKQPFNKKSKKRKKIYKDFLFQL
jgi:hypothetical protein